MDYINKITNKEFLCTNNYSLIPNVCHWQAEVYLAKLKSEHPQLKQLNWSEIEQNNELIAKLYSGYMGAGGD